MSNKTGYESAYDNTEGDGYNPNTKDGYNSLDEEDPEEPDKSDDKKSEPVPKT